MKNIHKIMLIISAFVCTGIINVNGQEKYFDNAEQAIEQARQDLMTILERGTDFNFDISIDELQNAEVVSRIEFRQLDYKRLLNTDTIAAISDLRSELLYYVVPLSAGNEVVTNIQITEAEEGWRISGLLNKNHTRAFNTIPAGSRNLKTMKIYEIPNINAVLYVLEMDDRSEIYTSYKGQFALQQPLEVSQIYPVLLNDAKKFEEKWGGQLNDQKLLK